MLRQKLDEKGLTGAKPAASTGRSATSYGDATYDDTSTSDVAPPSVASIP